jgi:hypothetical protein
MILIQVYTNIYMAELKDQKSTLVANSLKRTSTLLDELRDLELMTSYEYLYDCIYLYMNKTQAYNFTEHKFDFSDTEMFELITYNDKIAIAHQQDPYSTDIYPCKTSIELWNKLHNYLPKMRDVPKVSEKCGSVLQDKNSF